MKSCIRRSFVASKSDLEELQRKEPAGNYLVFEILDDGHESEAELLPVQRSLISPTRSYFWVELLDSALDEDF